MSDLTGFKRDQDGLFINHDPSANVNYGMDFSDYVQAGDSVQTATVSIESITGDAAPLQHPTDAATDVVITDNLVNIRLEGGTVNNIYTIKVTITTVNGDTDARSFRIVCKEKFL